jgi:hypothetical protein
MDQKTAPLNTPYLQEQYPGSSKLSLAVKRSALQELLDKQNDINKALLKSYIQQAGDRGLTDDQTMKGIQSISGSLGEEDSDEDKKDRAILMLRKQLMGQQDDE